ncbi:MAG: RDD family protein [Candidatus Tectomicrobia bacterium]|uniref:RDD family protein n=1 Tax=Tectimicrobiota bacterium TaxID=2528274 RepID=A0A932GS04_UNCTE|nr:RDD family protein [Candidatus Tectomicrobia bacterium]
MKCPKCSFVSFNYLETCRKCGNDLSGYRQERGFMDLAPGALDVSAPIIVEEEAETQEPSEVGVEEGAAGAEEETAEVEAALEVSSEGGIEIRFEETEAEPEASDLPGGQTGLVPEVEEEEISMPAIEDLAADQEEVEEEISMSAIEEISESAGEESGKSVDDLVLELDEAQSDQQSPAVTPLEEEETLSLEMEEEGGETAEEPPSVNLEDIELTLEEDDEEDEEDGNPGPGGNPSGGNSPGAGAGEDDSSLSFEIKMEQAEEIRGIIEEINRPPKEEDEKSIPSPLEGESREEGEAIKRTSSWQEAGVVRRLLAYATDHLFLGALAMVLTVGFFWLLFVAGRPLSSPQAFLQTLRFLGLGIVPWISALFVVYAGYYLYLVGSRGQTWGQALFGIRVVAEDRSPVGFARSALRLGGALLSWASCGMGFLWAALDRRHQGWPEKLSGTFVVLA